MFITFEGMDGSGKTTQISRVVAELSARGHDVLLTREPGGTDVGERVRTILMDKATVGLTARGELLLFCASRAQLVENVIRPHLAKGGVVVCDRYIDSSLVYQGYAHGLGVDAVQPVLEFATGGLLPDLTVYLDVAPEEGLRRRAEGGKRGEEYNRMDAFTDDFHRRVHEGYQLIGQRAGARWAAVDAGQTPDEVFAAIMKVVEQRLPNV